MADKVCDVWGVFINRPFMIKGHAHARRFGAKLVIGSDTNAMASRANRQLEFKR
jgi:hypothetical protein